MSASLITLLAFTSAFCSDSPDSSAGRHSPRTDPTDIESFEVLFEQQRQIALEERPNALITGIRSIHRRTDGLLATADFQESQVRIYTPDGRLQVNLGRFGEGPGEFRRPLDAVFTEDGALYVNDMLLPRITRFRADFSYDTAFTVRAAARGPLRALGHDLVVGHVDIESIVRQTDAGGFYGVYGPRGELRFRFHRLPQELYTEPYWFSALVEQERGGFYLAVGGGRALAANALSYNLVSYSVSQRDSQVIGQAPASWVPVPRVEPGRFASRPLQEFLLWARSFSTVNGVGIYRDSIIIVEYSPPRAYGRDERKRMLDLYTLEGRQIASQVPAPGPLVLADSAVGFLLAEAPFPWTVALYSIRRNIRQSARGIR